MKIIQKFLFALVATGLITACETEVKVNADYNQTAIVYGVLNSSDTTHIIKVSKTFLGDGNALDFAKVADSSKINNLQVVIEGFKDGVLEKTFLLRDTVISGKSSGLFYDGEQFAYYFREPDLNQWTDYKISFVAAGKEVSATTPMVEKPVISSPKQNLPINFVQESYFVNPKPNLLELKMSFAASKIAEEVEVSGIFHYKEVYLDNSFANKSIEMKIGKVITNNSNPKLTYSPESFFSEISNKVKPDNNVKRREIGVFEVKALNYTKDLKTYIDVNNPVSQLSQSQTEFTNINNGIGIFATSAMTFHSLNLHYFTDAYIAVDPRFDGLKFCSTNNNWRNEPKAYCQQ